MKYIRIIFNLCFLIGDELGNQYADAFPGHDEAKVTIKPRRWNSDVLGWAI